MILSWALLFASSIISDATRQLSSSLANKLKVAMGHLLSFSGIQNSRHVNTGHLWNNSDNFLMNMTQLEECLNLQMLPT